DVSAGFEVGAVDFGHNIGTRQIEEVVIPLQLLRPVFKPVAAIGGFFQVVSPQRRSHRPVNDDRGPAGLGFGVAVDGWIISVDVPAQNYGASTCPFASATALAMTASETPCRFKLAIRLATSGVDSSRSRSARNPCST